MSRSCGRAAACIGLVMICGCGGGGTKTHPVSGKVELPGGDVAILSGSIVEFVHETDETLRSSGKIQPDGSYTMQTLHQGKILPGTPDGKYKARIILGDESDEGVPKRKGKNPFHRRFLEFDTAVLSITVPSADYTVKLSAK